jgi:two-component system phosphate regulon sensor histidine kinase PhoR
LKFLSHKNQTTVILASAGAAALAVAGTQIIHISRTGFGDGWSLFSVACCLAGAMVVIWLGVYAYRLNRSVTSIANRLNEQSPPVCANGPAVAVELNHAIEQRLKDYRQMEQSLHEQVNQLNIQLQLAQRQKQNTDAIIYSIRDAVIVVDEHSRLLMANEAAGKLFGFNYRDVQLRSVEKIVSEDKKEFTTFLRKSRETRARATRRELQFAEADRVRTFDCIVSCVHDQREQVCGAVAVLHDITREKEVSQMKNDFVSHVSHELKTPLASIMAYSEMLADGEANDEKTQKEFYSIIQSQANRLSRLIDDILNTARIESGLIKVDKKPLSLTILIQEQLGMIKGYAEEKDIEVAGQEPIVLDQVNVDRDMMAQVVVNLLSNAVKYTAPGGKVEIKTEVDDIANLARVKITDTGVGIPEDEIEHVFDKFYRVGANNKQAKGTGLGLNLVKQIVEKVHGGKVFVTSKVNEGSTFGFELPLAANQPATVNG